MQLIRSFALVLGTASALQLPSAGVASRSAAASSTGPIARRQALATIGSAMAALATATGASAYDAIPEVQTDFAASERVSSARKSSYPCAGFLRKPSHGCLASPLLSCARSVPILMRSGPKSCSRSCASFTLAIRTLAISSLLSVPSAVLIAD